MKIDKKNFESNQTKIKIQQEYFYILWIFESPKKTLTRNVV
jgi:hypothetical protein